MSSSIPETQIESVSFSQEKLHVSLNDGRVLSLPLDWYPTLQSATSDQRANWRIVGEGEGIHWSDLIEDLSLESFLRGTPAMGSTEYQRRREPVGYVVLDQDLSARFQTEGQVNETLREHLRMKQKSA